MLPPGAAVGRAKALSNHALVTFEKREREGTATVRY